MMRATIHRSWHALCAGRSPYDIATRLTVAFGLAGALWMLACVFLLMEPAA